MAKANIIRVLLAITSLKHSEIARFANTTRYYVSSVSFSLRNPGKTKLWSRNGQKKYRLKYTDRRNKHRKTNYLKGREHNTNSWKRWTDEEKEIIKSNSSKTDRELAEEIGRSVQAIQMKRCKDKK